MGDFAPHGSQGGGFGGPAQVRHVPMIHVAAPSKPTNPSHLESIDHPTSTFDTNDNTHLHASFPHTFVRRAGRWSS